MPTCRWLKHCLTGTPETMLTRTRTLSSILTAFCKVDAYRNKMRTSMLAAGQEASEIPKHFDTRRGKRRFLERARKTESDAPSAAQRSAGEVEG